MLITRDALVRAGLQETANAVILEESSIELVPRKYWRDHSCKEVERRFGVSPEFQILDSNFHNRVVSRLKNSQKRGRPDVVHFALLDITSTPLYMNDKIQVIIHTIDGHSIFVGKRVRVPRTLQRFCGVISKILSESQNEAEMKHFEFAPNQTTAELISSIKKDRTIALSSQGIRTDLSTLVSETQSENKSTAWIIGGFPHGHFEESSRAIFDRLLSISESPLPAHVVTARLCYELERILLNQ
ncbi:MAG: ribosomal RNA small subunit methyltransferase NEP1 [Thaumarchaeota archaeon]|nr:ribosomal RNA small subunit methyltransferase NEP1 [Nitrososphaerota archaeon]MDG6906586.1 hypothetical protein [Nitrososphaerota archaeon]